MEAAGSNPVLDAHGPLSGKVGKYAYTVEKKDGQALYTVTDGSDSLTLPIKWMFGQHSQTWVLEKDGHLYESLVSYFPGLKQTGPGQPGVGGLATTPGDDKLAPTNLTEAMGRKLPTWETLQCFQCHASGAVDGVKLTLDKLKPGLDCEHCHVGGELHMADAANGNFKTLPAALKKMDAEQVSTFCGQCHRTFDIVARNHWKGPAFVRFQPYRLENSKCFVGNDARISCLGCHNPHEPVKHDAAYYDGKCLACHAPSVVGTHPAEHAPKVCPVAKANCATCHMPKVDLPGGHQPFTDHMIRIARAGDAYPD